MTLNYTYLEFSIVFQGNLVGLYYTSLCILTNQDKSCVTILCPIISLVTLKFVQKLIAWVPIASGVHKKIYSYFIITLYN